jgi:hypothetical protein
VTALNPLTVNSSVSPRKNNVQLLNITGGGGGGVIKEMSASLLKTLLGGDNAKYPVILDFSKGYLLANDYFVASCPDIIKECDTTHDTRDTTHDTRDTTRTTSIESHVWPFVCVCVVFQDQSLAQSDHRVQLALPPEQAQAPVPGQQQGLRHLLRGASTPHHHHPWRAL